MCHQFFLLKKFHLQRHKIIGNNHHQQQKLQSSACQLRLLQWNKKSVIISTQTTTAVNRSNDQQLVELCELYELNWTAVKKLLTAFESSVQFTSSSPLLLHSFLWSFLTLLNFCLPFFFFFSLLQHSSLPPPTQQVSSPPPPPPPGCHLAVQLGQSPPLLLLPYSSSTTTTTSTTTTAISSALHHHHRHQISVSAFDWCFFFFFSFQLQNGDRFRRRCPLSLWITCFSFSSSFFNFGWYTHSKNTLDSSQHLPSMLYLLPLAGTIFSAAVAH